MVAVVALYAGNTTAMLAALEPVIKVTQDTDDAAAFGSAGARILEKLIIYNISGFDAVNETVGELLDPARVQPYDEDAALAAGLQNALAHVGESNFDFVQSIGQSCDYPYNLWTGAQLIAQLDDSAASYVSGVRQTIMAGGDSGSRGLWTGAAAAARMGSADLIPAAWTAATGVYATVVPLAAQLVGHRARVHGGRA